MATEATTATGLPSTYEAIGMVTGDIIPSAMSNPVSIPVSHQTVLIPIMVVGLIAIPVCIPYGVCLYTAINPDPSSFATFVISGTLIAITWSPITKYLITIKWSQII